MEQPAEMAGGVQRLADLLRRCSGEIETRWLGRVSRELERHGLSQAELRNSIPDYITGLASALERENGRSMDERGVEAWSETARNHALTRIQLGFDIDAVLKEFLILRSVILEVLGEYESLTFNESERVTVLIGGALRACVKSYVDSRDYEARQQQAKHIGFITHELRNPLATSMMAAGQLRKRGTPEQARYFELLERNHRRLRDLIDATLLAEQLEVNEFQSNPTEVRLGELMERALTGAKETAKDKQVHFEVSYDEDIMLLIDPELARSAVQNVVDNAAKFTDRGRVLVRVEDAASEVIVHVYDECEGISPEELRTVFEPFKRGHTGKPGTGLGLAIARRAVEAHGKTIHVESSGNHGCHFWFSLPKASH